MPGGVRDSSLTRVVPIFRHLAGVPGHWPKRLLRLAAPGPADASDLNETDFSFLRGSWGDKERGLDPPVSLLSWLIRHPSAWASEPDGDERMRLQSGDPATVERAIAALRGGYSRRDWFVLEGQTFPDALIETPDALVVIEGKRTEAGPTTHTKWMAGRHQIWRHIDAAWEIRGRRRVFGLFIVEGKGAATPEIWVQAARDAVAESSLRASFPHRSGDEVAALRRCFYGVTTWARVCAEFGIAEGQLPETTDDLRI